MRILLLLTATMFTRAALADWPQFRGPNGSGRYDGTEPLPVEWSANDGVLWKVPLPGAGSSSPVVLADRVVVTAYTGYGLDAENAGDLADLRLHVLCFDRETGRELWRSTLEASPDERPFSGQMTNHGYATPTPCLDADGVVASFGVSGLVAYDWDGREQWRAEVGTKTAGFGTSSSPIIVGDFVVLNASIEAGRTFAVDRATGEERWSVPDVSKSWSVPVVAETDAGRTLVLNQKQQILGLDPATGKELWRCDGVRDYVVPVPVVGPPPFGKAGESVVVCFGGRRNQAVGVRLGGRGDVTESHRLFDANIGANVTSPVYLTASEAGGGRDRVYCATDKAIAHCVDAATGETVYKTRLPTRARVYASVVYGDGRLYAQTRDAGLVVYRPGEAYEELAVNVLEPDALFNATPALDRGRVYLRSDGWLYCVGGSSSG